MRKGETGVCAFVFFYLLDLETLLVTVLASLGLAFVGRGHLSIDVHGFINVGHCCLLCLFLVEILAWIGKGRDEFFFTSGGNEALDKKKGG